MNDESRLIGSILSEDARKKLSVPSYSSFERSSSAPPAISELRGVCIYMEQLERHISVEDSWFISDTFDEGYYAYYHGNRALNPRLAHPLQTEWPNFLTSQDAQSVKLTDGGDLSPRKRKENIWSNSMTQSKPYGPMGFQTTSPTPPFGAHDNEEFLKSQSVSNLNGTSSGPGLRSMQQHQHGVHNSHHDLSSHYYNEGEEEMLSQMQNLSIGGDRQSLYAPNHPHPFPHPYTHYPQFGTQPPHHFYGPQMNQYQNQQFMPPHYSAQNFQYLNGGGRGPTLPRQQVPYQNNPPQPPSSAFEKSTTSSSSAFPTPPQESVSPVPQATHPSGGWDRLTETPQTHTQNAPQHTPSTGGGSASTSSSGRGSNRGHSRKNRHVKNKNHNDQSTHSRSKLMEEFKKGYKKLELRDITGHVVEFSRDQHGSRFIQQKLENASPQEKEIIFDEIKPEALSLMTDVFGNYVIQKFFDFGNKRHKKQLANELTGNVLFLTLQTYGCRVIQKALEVIDTDDQKIIGDELKNHVIKCVLDQNGNHVIQKCIERMSPSRVQFIVDSFCGQIQLQSRHAYGCRVIQRMLEHCTDEQTAPLLEEILGCVQELVTDQYGNYVVQHVLEHGKPEYRCQIINALKGKFAGYSVDKYASNVVEKSFVFGSAEERDKIITEITSKSENPEIEDPILAMMNDQYANFVIQKIIEASTEDQRIRLIAGITPHLPAIRSKTFGKHIISCISNFSETPIVVPKEAQSS